VGSASESAREATAASALRAGVVESKKRRVFGVFEFFF